MKKLLTLLLFVTSVFAQEVWVNIQVPVYAQLVQTKLPSTWNVSKPYFEQASPSGHYIIEFAKKTQKNLLTIQGFKNAAMRPNMRAKNLEVFISRSIQKVSPENFVYNNIAQTKIQGYDAIISLIGCSMLPKKVGHVEKGSGELGLYLFLKGKEDMYIIHRSWRTKAFNESKKIPVDKKEIEKWINILAKHTNFL